MIRFKKLNIEAYKPGKSSIKKFRKIIKLSANESALGMSSRVKKVMSNKKLNFFRYPDGKSKELRNQIAKKFKCNKDRIICGAGSDEVIQMLCQLFLRPKDDVIVPQFSFLMYRIYAKIVGANVIFSKEEKFKVSVSEIIKKVTKKTKIVFLANPNNPTGTYLTKVELIELRKKLRKNILLVVDDAYTEYMKNSDYKSGLDLFKNKHNVFILRTFSKIYGLASLRLGWCYAHTDIIKLMNKVRGPFNVNQIAQLAGVEALKDKKYEKNAINHNKFWLKKMNSELSRLPVNVYDSRANFLLINVGKSVKKLNQYLLSKSIIVRLMDKYNLPDCIRLSIGKSTENRKVLKAMKEFYNAK